MLFVQLRTPNVNKYLGHQLVTRCF